MTLRAVSPALCLGLLTAAGACAHNPGPAATQPQPAGPAAAAPASRAPAPAPGGSAPPADPAAPPAPAPAMAAVPASGMDLTGSWSGTVDFQGQAIGVDVTLRRGADGRYTGEAAPQGATAAPLTALRLDGPHLVMVFSTPDGEATFDMMLTTDRQAFTGTITYQGQQIPFTARKRP